ncbi:unnamed protein product, partial [marine sediment metagenome]
MAAKPRASERTAKPYRVFIDYGGLTLVLIGLIAVFSLSTDHFFTLTTFRTIANQIPDAIVIAVGMTFVLIIAGIDLSVGSVLAFSGGALGVCLTRGMPLSAAILACLAVGLACGTINGLMVTRWRLPSFIVTLGMLEAARGASYLVTQSRTQYIGASIERVADASVFGLSFPFLVAIVIVVSGQIVLSGTVFGRHMFATGANEEAARLSGLNTRAI